MGSQFPEISGHSEMVQTALGTETQLKNNSTQT